MVRCHVFVALALLAGCEIETKRLDPHPPADGDADADGDGDADADGDGDGDADGDGDGDADVCVPSGVEYVCAGGGAARCCSRQCAFNLCTPGDCRVIGDACGQDADCCSGSCREETCRDIEGECLPKGELCEGSGDCCSLYCHGNPPHCSTTPGEPCLARGELCDAEGEGGECCTGSCVAGRCTDGEDDCGREGEPCASSASCCSEVCGGGGDGMPPRCTEEG